MDNCINKKKGTIKELDNPVDIFLPWVDGNDVDWQKKRNKYKSYTGSEQAEANGIERYRDWENLKYIFRGIDKFLPWIRKVFLVTDGQVPEFLDLTNPKLVIVDHKEYIPEEFLPTFNSNTIEMNLHRIEDISDNVLLFNDDTFIIDYVDKTYFIKNGIPGDEAIERIIGNVGLTHAHSLTNNAWIINKYFDKNRSKHKNWSKWYTIKYGKDILRNICFDYFRDFQSLRNPHEPFLLKKKIFEKIWELEPNMLHMASMNKFRDVTDVTQYVVRFWNIFEGDFVARKHKGKALTVDDFNYLEISEIIKKQKYPLISIDEKSGKPVIQFEKVRDSINSAFSEIFPEKCSYEK